MDKSRIVGKDTGYIGGIAKKMIRTRIDTVSGFKVALTVIDSTFSYGRYAIKYNAKAIVDGGWETKRMGSLNLSKSAFYKAVTYLRSLGIIGTASQKDNKYIFIDVKSMMASALKEMIEEGANETDYFKVINDLYTKVCKDYMELGICSELSYKEVGMKIKDIKGVVPEKTAKRKEKESTKDPLSYTEASLLKLMISVGNHYSVAVSPTFSSNEEERYREIAGMRALIKRIPSSEMRYFITAVISNWDKVHTFLTYTERYDVPYAVIDIETFCLYRRQIYAYYKTGFAKSYPTSPTMLERIEDEERITGKKVISLDSFRTVG